MPRLTTGLPPLLVPAHPAAAAACISGICTPSSLSRGGPIYFPSPRRTRLRLPAPCPAPGPAPPRCTPENVYIAPHPAAPTPHTPAHLSPTHSPQPSALLTHAVLLGCSGQHVPLSACCHIHLHYVTLHSRQVQGKARAGAGSARARAGWARARAGQARAYPQARQQGTQALGPKHKLSNQWVSRGPGLLMSGLAPV